MIHFRMCRFVCTGLVLLLIGCDDGSSAGSEESMGGNDIRGLGGGSTMQTGGTTQDPPSGGTASPVAGTPTAGQAMGGGDTPVDDCMKLCDKYAECERSNIGPGRSQDNCIMACRTLDELPTFGDYVSCVNAKACGELQDCPIPSSIQPVQCSEVCEALASDTCQGDRRLPAGFPEVESCSQGCEFVALERQILECGEAIVANADACNEEAFAWCLVQKRSLNCAQLCDKRSQCEMGIDRVDCAISCIQDEYDNAQNNMMLDPVTARRQREALNCILNAPNCDAHTECQRGPGRLISDEAVDALCAADVQCNFMPAGDACPPVARRLLRATSDRSAQCLEEKFETACGESPLNCIEPYIPGVDACAEYCQVASQCQQLPDGLTRNECEDQCESAVSRANQDGLGVSQLGPFRQGLACAYSESCADFSGCMESAGDASCMELCDQRQECSLDSADGCAEACEDRKQTLRNWSERTCTAAAGACGGVGACVAPDGPDCNRYCGLIENRCGQVEETCPLECDNRHYVSPEVFLPNYACTAVARDCESHQQCGVDGNNPGLACLNWCRAEVSCQGSDDGVLDCIDACADGYTGERGLVFEGARACLQQAGVDAQCADLSACITASNPGGFCSEYCREIGPEGCMIIDDVADCEAQCGQLFSNGPMGGVPMGGLPVGGALMGGTVMGGAIGGEPSPGGIPPGGGPVGGVPAGGAVVGGASAGGSFTGGNVMGGVPAAGMAAGGDSAGGAPMGGAPGGSAAGGTPMGGRPVGGQAFSGGAMAGTPVGGAAVDEMRGADPIAHTPTLDGVGCVISALRNGLGCAAIAECVGAAQADAMDCPADAEICLPAPSQMCRDYCTAQAKCDAQLDVFRCQRACTPNPDFLAVRSTCSGLIAGCVGTDNCARWPACVDQGAIPDACEGVSQCDKQNLCDELDGVIPDQCIQACMRVDGCQDDFIAEAQYVIAPSLAQCQIDCAAQSALGPDGRQAFLDGLEPCLTEAMCAAEPVTRCMRGVPPVDCESAAMAMQECLDNAGDFGALLGIPPGGVAGFVMACQDLAQQDPAAAEEQIECVINAQANGGGGAPLPIPIPGFEGLLACAPYLECFGGGGGLIPVP